jgi:hypothetical protein
MAKTAIVDIDNTLWQFCDAFYVELAALNRNFPTPDTWTNWDIWEGYCSEKEFYAAINIVHANQDRSSYLPYPEAREFLASLRANNYHITIASHRAPEHRGPTERWLKRHGLVYDELHLSFTKTDIFNSLTDVVVDDAPQVLEKAVESGAKATGLLFPWNAEYRNNGFGLYKSLDEILCHILN